jgi:hypothetical protein
MPAWRHTNRWSPGFYQMYRKYVEAEVPNAGVSDRVKEGAGGDGPLVQHHDQGPRWSHIGNPGEHARPHGEGR